MGQTIRNKMCSILYGKYSLGKGMPKSLDPDLIYIHSHRTLDNYIHGAKRFAAWLKEQGIKSGLTVEEARQYIQPYLDSLVARGLAPATVHAEAAAICKALGDRMANYDVPRRDTPPRMGREVPSNMAEIESDPRYQRSIPFAKAVGIRREEYAALKGRDLVYRDGRCYVHVAQGKGGKEQYQLIDDADVPVVEACFAGLGPDDPVFASWELRGLKSQRYRRENTQEKYDLYVDRMAKDPTYRQELIRELKHTFDQAGRNWRKNHDMRLLNRPYYTQKGVRRDMIAHGRPVSYDRVALMAVSVWHLSHWRTGVTVGHYMR